MAYFIGMTVVLPLVLAVVLLINTNSLLRRAAVFFMAAALPACAVWVIAHGAGVYTPEPGLAKFLWSTFMVGNFTVLFVTAWLGWRWKSYIIVAMAAIQAAMLCWIYFQPGNESGGVFSLDHLSMAFLLLADVVGPLTLLAARTRRPP